MPIRPTVAWVGALCLALLHLLDLWPLAASAQTIDFSVCDSGHAPSGRTQTATPATLASLIAKSSDGDILLLTSGQYGSVVLNGKHGRFVTLAAARDQIPRLRSLTIQGSHWVVRGVTVSGYASAQLWGGYEAHEPLVTIREADNVIVDGNIIQTVAGAYPWREIFANVPNSQGLSSGVFSRDSRCVTVKNNRISNVFNGVAYEGDQVDGRGTLHRILNNIINDFGGDGVDQGGSRSVIKGNLIYDGHQLCHEACIHNDGIQGWGFHNRPDIVTVDVIIDGNTIIQKLSPNELWVADDMHGITIFDGTWRNVRISNNVVLTGTWHGISISGTDHLTIVNNTVVSLSDRSTWILVDKGRNGAPNSDHVLIANNIMTFLNLPPYLKDTPRLSLKRNLVGGSPQALFRKFDIQKRDFDLHLRAGSPAIGRGDRSVAPDVDIEGKPRQGSADQGAYAYVNGAS